MKKSIVSAFVLIVCIIFINGSINAQVTIQQATNGTNISGSTAANGSSPSQTTLGDIKVTSAHNNDFAKNQTNAKVILTAPSNWSFNASVGTGSVSGTNITYVSISVTSTTITFTYTTGNTNSSNAAFTISGIQVQEIDGANISQGSILRTGGTGTITGITNNVTSFGTLSGDGVLPVELLSFFGSVNGNTIILKWTTATEVNNYGFDVERNSGNGWTNIGFVSGSGNSNAPKNYSFTDQPTGATSFSYRLKQIDVDGAYKYYDAITVSLVGGDKVQLMQNSPNSFNPSTSIKYYVPQTMDITITIYDIIGREVTKIVNNQATAGYHVVYWNGKDSYGNVAASGIYIYRLTASNFTETKKMNLLK